MANNAKLTVTAVMDDQASGPMRKIAGETQKLGLAVSKSAQVMGLMGGVAGQLDGKIGQAAQSVTGLASALMTGGVFGIAMAAATAAAQGFVLALNAIADASDKALEESDVFKRAKAIANLDKIERERAASLKKTQDDALKQVDQENAGNLRNAAVLTKMHEEQDARDAKSKTKADQHQRDVEAWVEAEVAAYNKMAEAEEEAEKQAIESNKSRYEHELALAEFKRELADSEREYDEEVKREQAERYGEVTETMKDMSSSLTQAMISDSHRGQAAAVRAVVSGVLDVIQAKAVEAAATAGAKAFSEYPPIIAAAVSGIYAGIAYGAITAFRAKVVKAADGGLITGGTPGRDSVPAMLMPGELVVRAPVVQQIEKMAANGGMGGDIHVHVGGIHTLDPGSVRPADLRRIAVTLGNEIQTMRGRGMVGGRN